MNRFGTAVAAITLTLGLAPPAHATDTGTRLWIPCADARTAEQLEACAEIRRRAAEAGISGSDVVADGEPAKCWGNSWADRKSFAFIAKEYWGQMIVECDYPVDICFVNKMAAGSVPQFTYGVGGIIDPSLHCGAQTIAHSYGWSVNVTTTVGSCLSNNTFWVESEPETRVWS
ncbi:MAG TPA: hypothetical protein VNQ77_05545 [Frankiaceae bacterium]|nr:hypothetical protein [Frankiaceae bacterium]